MNIILVDFDGTLVDSVPLLYQTYLQFLSHYGYIGSEDEFKACCGMTIPQFVQHLVKRYSIPGVVANHTCHYYDAVSQVYQHKMTLFPGARQVLAAIQARGMRLAIVTASQQPLVQTFLERNDLEDIFEQIVTAEGLVASKPDPAIYRRALAVMQAAPEDCLAIEDSAQGVAAAVGASVSTVAFGAHWEFNDLPPNVNIAATWEEVGHYVH